MINHEKQDLSFRTVALALAGLLLLMLIVHVVSVITSGVLSSLPEMSANSYKQPKLPPEPRLQANPAQDLARQRESEEAVLTTYGWIDRAHGVVRVPIDRAMDLTLERKGRR